MNKKSKALQERNKQIQAQYSKKLGKKSKTSILSIYAELAVEFDLSIERVREIVCNRRI